MTMLSSVGVAPTATSFKSTTRQTMTITVGRHTYRVVPPQRYHETTCCYQENWTIRPRSRATSRSASFWEDNFGETAVDWGKETYTPTPGAYIHIAVCRHSSGISRYGHIEARRSMVVDQAVRAGLPQGLAVLRW
jgi:hypothetical protein